MSLLVGCTYVTREMRENVVEKIKYFHSHVIPNQRKLKLAVFSDHASISQKMWDEVFNLDLVSYYFSTDFPLIPNPDPYDPATYGMFVKELKNVIFNYMLDKKDDTIWGLFNLAAKDASPRINLALSNRRLMKEEFKIWIENVEKSSNGAEDKDQTETSKSSAEASSKGSADDQYSSPSDEKSPEGSAKSSESSARGKRSSSDFVSIGDFCFLFSTAEDFRPILSPISELPSSQVTNKDSPVSGGASVLPKKGDDSGAGSSSQQ